MNSYSLKLAFAFAIALPWTLASPAAAQLGGNPGDAYSCYSDCGVRGGTAAQRCACDDSCNVRGDCCSDRNLYCATSVAAPACSLTTSNTASHGSLFCGTDLGFVVPHDGKLEVLFGDSWEWNPLWPGTCTTRGLLGLSDDAQGTLPVARPASAPFRAASIPASGISDCHSSILTLDTSGTPRNYTSIKLFMPVTGEELQLPPGSTPTAAFSDGLRMWAMFKANGPPERAEPGHTYLAYRETGRTNYRVRVDLGNNDNNLFLNPSATRIATYNATDPKLSNFAPPSGTNAGVLLIFGRKKFWSGSSEDADANGMYLVRQDTRISTSGAQTWNPQYFKGVDPTTDKPLWTSTASEAVPMLTAAGSAAGDFKAVNEIDVKWVPELRKWVLLYGGGVHWTLENDPPTNDQPRYGAIHMRTADYPWGPWSPPTPVLLREKMRGYFECDATEHTAPAGCDPAAFSTGTWEPEIGKSIAGCTSALSEPVQPNSSFFTNPLLTDCFIGGQPIYDQRGLLYSAELIPTWTNAGTPGLGTWLRTVTLYFLVSTWMPYQVVLAAADLNVPIATYSQGPMVVQLRDYQSKLATVGTSPPNVSNTINGTTAWWIQHTDSAQPNRPIQIGDVVYFRSMSDNGLTYLSRSGDNVRFDKPGTNLEDRLKWRIDTIDPVRYPVGMKVELGKTPIAIRDLGERRLKSKSTGLRNLVGAGGDSVWTLSWHCQSGDSCP